MNRSYKIIPVYTGDVSGVCSALYELGGMVVIHDPSGCNSTYNTHDETRWYDQDSLIYITGLSHIDAIMGNDEKYVRDIVRAAGELHPKFIALTSSPVPYINGTDFHALKKLIERETSVPVFFVQTNGMHDYTVGAGNALKEIAMRYCKKESDGVKKRRINLLGVTPLDFAHPDSCSSLRLWLRKQGWEEIFCFAMEDDLEHLKHAADADVSLVVSLTGLGAAKYLEENFGIPYVAGVPVKGFEEVLREQLLHAADQKESCLGYAVSRAEAKAGENKMAGKITLVGEPVLMESFAAAIRLQSNMETTVISTLEGAGALLLPTGSSVTGEEAVEQLLMQAQSIIADPLYQPICNPQADFMGMPHLAFSGRCFIKQMPNYLEVDINEQLKRGTIK